MSRHKDTVCHVEFDPNGSFIASGSDDGTIRLFSLEEIREKMTIKAHKSEVNSVAISNDGAFILSGSNDNSIKIWEASSGALIKSLLGHSAKVTSVQICPNDEYIISSSLFMCVYFLFIYLILFYFLGATIFLHYFQRVT